MTDVNSGSSASSVASDEFAVSSLADTATAATTADITALLDGDVWGVTSLTYSFPTDWTIYPAGYSYSYEQYFFDSMPDAGQEMFTEGLEAYDAISGLTLTLVDPSADADIRIAGTEVTPTAWAYHPGNDSSSGDIWVNTEQSYNSGFKYTGLYIGSYEYLVAIHETGHALGLKHPHATSTENSVTLDAAFDSLEYTVMSYRSYTGDPSAGSYSNGEWGYPQSLMMLDVAAIQELYGADYSSNATDTVYKFDVSTGEMFINGVGQGTPGANVVFRNIWDGGGNDTLDLSDYTTNLSIDLRAGGGSDFSVDSNFQAANVHKYGSTYLYAEFSLTMSLLFDGNTDSLIEGAIGGSGDDIFIGNEADNWFNGGLGADTYYLGEGADIVSGTLEELTGDTLMDFDSEDQIVITGGLLRLQSTLAVFGAETFGVEAVESDPLADSTTTEVNISLVSGAVQVYSDGVETVVSYAEAQTVALADMASTYIYSGTDAVKIYTGEGINYAAAGAGDDMLYGGDGNDTLRGNAGDDTINAGGGYNVVEGGAGSDLFVVDAGTFTDGVTNFTSIDDFDLSEDSLELTGFGYTSVADLTMVDLGSSGTYIVFSGGGLILGDISPDEVLSIDITFGDASDSFFAIAEEGVQTYTDSAEVISFSDETTGQTVYAGAGNDSVRAGDFGDTLYGEAGGDSLFGFGGDDTLYGGEGYDTLTGGDGNDIFVFAFEDTADATLREFDTVMDFTGGEDTIVFDGFGLSSLEGLTNFSFGGDTYIYLSTYQAIVFEEYASEAAVLAESDSFLFT